MVLNATVNQVDAEKLRLGMKAIIHLDAYPDIELPGTLVGIGAMAKASTFRARFVGEIPIRIKLEKTDPRVIPDLTGSAEIVLNAERNTMIAPLSAVFAEESGVLRIRSGLRRLDQEKGGARPAQFHDGGDPLRIAKRGRNRAAASHVAAGLLQETKMASKDQRPSQRLGKSNPRRAKIITWMVGSGPVRRRSRHGLPLHRHHRSGSAGGSRAARRIHHQRAHPRRHQERPFRHPQSAPGARPAHRPPGRCRPARQEGRRGGGVRRLAAGPERHQPHHHRARRRWRHRADQGYAEDRRRSRLHEQDVRRVRSGARQAGRQQSRSAFGHRWREEPHSGGRVRGLAANRQGLHQRPPGGPRCRPEPPQPAQRQGGPRFEYGAELPGHDAASRAERRHRERAAQLPLAGLVRPGHASF